MQTPSQPIPSEAAVIDLGPICAACRGLVSWYDRHLDGDEPPVAELDVRPAERIPATDLDYLDLILREKLQAESRLASSEGW